MSLVDWVGASPIMFESFDKCSFLFLGGDGDKPSILMGISSLDRFFFMFNNGLLLSSILLKISFLKSESKKSDE